jgi:hypothetical protein
MAKVERDKRGKKGEGELGNTAEATARQNKRRLATMRKLQLRNKGEVRKKRPLHGEEQHTRQAEE